MVDFKLLLNPPVARKVDFLRRRCRRDIRDFASFPCARNCSEEQLLTFDHVDQEKPRVKRRYIIGAGAAVVIIILVVLAYCTDVFSRKSAAAEPPDPTEPLPPSPSILHEFRKAAVCVDAAACAEIGRDILEKNGSVVDATIASMFCNGMVTMQSMGLGGGFLMTIYKRDEQKAYFLNAREKAPLNLKLDVYKNDPVKTKNGIFAVGVPGELRGYWTVYKKFGRLPWKDLIEPTINLCERGYNMSLHQYQSIFRSNLHDDPNLNEWLHDAEGNFKKPGSKIVPTRLCNTLKLIAENGGDDLYNGTLSQMLLDDIREEKGIITQEDLDQYEAQWMEPISVKFRNGDNLFSAPPPGSGVLLAFILKILDGYNFDKNSINGVENTITTYHRIIEAFKYAYAKRTELADTNFVNLQNLLMTLTSTEYADSIRAQIKDNLTSSDPKHYGAKFYMNEDHGTSHVSILGPDGDAVSVTSSINIYFGAGFTSKKTGIILNSVMDDFSFPDFVNFFGLPGSPNNKPEPGKRPLSSMAPSIVTDKNGDVRMVVGAAGGTRITSTVAQVIMRALWFGQNIKEAVDAPRLHNQLYPMRVDYEYGTLKGVVEGLQALGHKLFRATGSIACALIKVADKIVGNADYRKGGEVFGIA